jgi:hypothetical protein
VQINSEATNRIQELCHAPIDRYARSSAPFRYADAKNGTEIVVTGLLLGYPLESTASIIERHGWFPVKK